MIDIAIIGAGPAGLSAAIYASRAGFSAVAFEELVAGGQLTSIDRLENYPGFAEGIGGFDIALALRAQAERFGSQIVSENVNGLRVPAEEGEPFVIETNAGSHEARSVVIATGAKPRPLPVEGSERLVGRGISYCATCDGNFFRGKRVAVVGGGDTACADAVYLSRIASEVHLIHRRTALRAAPWYAARLEGLEGLERHLGYTVEALHESDGRLTGLDMVDVESGEVTSLPVDGLFVAVGTAPETSWIDGAVELDEAGYVVSHDEVLTSRAGVFVAGDVRTSPLRQVVTAASDGALAAEAAAKYLAS